MNRSLKIDALKAKRELKVTLEEFTHGIIPPAMEVSSPLTVNRMFERAAILTLLQNEFLEDMRNFVASEDQFLAEFKKYVDDDFSIEVLDHLTHAFEFARSKAKPVKPVATLGDKDKGIPKAPIVEDPKEVKDSKDPETKKDSNDPKTKEVEDMLLEAGMPKELIEALTKTGARVVAVGGNLAELLKRSAAGSPFDDFFGKKPGAN